MARSFWSHINRVFQAAYGASLAVMAILTVVGVLATGGGSSGATQRAALAQSTATIGGVVMSLSVPITTPNGRLTLKLAGQELNCQNLVSGACVLSTHATQIYPGPTANYTVQATGVDERAVVSSWITQNSQGFAGTTRDTPRLASTTEGSWDVTATTAASTVHSPNDGRFDYLYAQLEQVYRFGYGFEDDDGHSYDSLLDIRLDHPPTPLRNLVVQLTTSKVIDYDPNSKVTVDLRAADKQPWQANGYQPGQELVIRFAANSPAFQPTDGVVYSAASLAAARADLKLIPAAPGSPGLYVDDGPLAPDTTYSYAAWAYDDGNKYSLPLGGAVGVPSDPSPSDPSVPSDPWVVVIPPELPPVILPDEGCASIPAAGGSALPEIVAGGTIKFTCTLPREPADQSLVPVDADDRPKDLSAIRLSSFADNARLRESRSMYYLNGLYTIRLSKNQRDVGQAAIEVEPGNYSFSFFVNALPPQDNASNVLTNLVAGIHTLDFEIRVTAADGTVKTGKMSDYPTYALPSWRVLAGASRQFNARQPDCPFSTFDLLRKDYQYPANFSWDRPNWDELKSKCDLPFTFLDDAAGGSSASVCRNSITEPPLEQCDDGNDINDDACSNACQRNYCGDGQVQANPKNAQNIVEVCDSGPGLPTATCDAQCQAVPAPVIVQGNGTCGDGMINWLNESGIYEQCDGGAPTAVCDAQCQLINLGGTGGGTDGGGGTGGTGTGGAGTDGTGGTDTAAPCGSYLGGQFSFYCPDPALPVCDVPNGLCKPIAVCGNGQLESWGGEICDDGNLDNNDRCDADCRQTVCGDFIVQTPNGVGADELCDDGNTIANDLCSFPACREPICGDGITQAIIGEQCDDGGIFPGDGCSATCQSEAAPLPPNPSCDANNPVCEPACNSFQTCTNTCECQWIAIPTCSAPKPGGYIQPVGVTCINDCPVGQACSANCECEPPPPVCGDGVINQASEQCDDGNTAAGDGCDGGCQLETAPPIGDDPGGPVTSLCGQTGTGTDGPICGGYCPQGPDNFDESGKLVIREECVAGTSSCDCRVVTQEDGNLPCKKYLKSGESVPFCGGDCPDGQVCNTDAGNVEVGCSCGQGASAIMYQGKYVALSYLHSASPDTCASTHWHAISSGALATDCTTITDPAPSGCGFGALDGTQIVTVPITDGGCFGPVGTDGAVTDPDSSTPPDTCAGRSNCDYAYGAPCQCDSGCSGFGDCCADQASVCASGTANTTDATDAGLSVTVLENGIAVTGIEGSVGDEKNYKLAVPAGAASLEIKVWGWAAGGDADLHVKFGSAPTALAFDYRPYLDGTLPETVTVNNPAAGDWYIMVRAFKAYVDLSLQATHVLADAGGTSTGDTPTGAAAADTPDAPLSTASPALDESFYEISAGTYHTCAITAVDGRVDCWGDNYAGQLGTGQTNVPQLSQAGVLKGEATADDHDGTYLDNISRISSGHLTTCAVSIANNLYCWGSNVKGELGIGNVVSSSPLPKRVLAGAEADASETDGTYLTKVSGVVVGKNSVCAITFYGNLYCWGGNSSGQVGDGSTETRYLPVRVRKGEGPSSNGVNLTGITAVSLDGSMVGYGSVLSHACALAEGGSVYCWGGGAAGRLGNGATTDSSTPVRVLKGEAVSGDYDGIYLTGMRTISVGGAHTCTVSLYNRPYCWGTNSQGQLGGSNVSTSSVPLRVKKGAALAGDYDGDYLDNILLIKSGGSHVCTISNAHNPYCWGDNPYGQLGNGAATDQYSPVRVLAGNAGYSDVYGGYLIGIYKGDGGENHTCLLTGSGTRYCFGQGIDGQLGTGATTDKNQP